VAPPLWLQSADAYVPLSPPPKSLGGLHEGIGAGSAAGIGGAAGLGAGRRRLGAALRADFFLVDRFAAAFAVLRFLRAGAALFWVDRFFASLLFAMIALPILFQFVRSLRRNRHRTRAVALRIRHSADPFSADCRCRLLRRARNFLGPMLPQHRGTRPA